MLPITSLRNQDLILISIHLDTVFNDNSNRLAWTEFDSEGNFLLGGALDNAVHATIMVEMLLREGNQFPSNIIVVFTPNEEIDQSGAKQVIAWLRKQRLHVRCAIVLDICSNEFDAQNVQTIVRNNLGADAMWTKLYAEYGENPKVRFIDRKGHNETATYWQARIPTFNITAPSTPDFSIHTLDASIPAINLSHTYELLRWIIFEESKNASSSRVSILSQLALFIRGRGHGKSNKP